MIKEAFIFLILVGWLGKKSDLMAQDPQFSQYYAAPLYLNPGLVGVSQKGRLGILYRSQWPNLEANFETFSMYVDHHIEDYYSSVGLLFTRDQEGIAGLSSTMAGLQYAYQLQLNDNWTFRPGIQLAYFSRDLDFSKLTFGDQFDERGQISPTTQEVFNTGLQARFFDLSFGGVFYSPNLWVGAAVHHVTEPNQSITGGHAPLPRQVSFHGGYRIPFGPRVNTRASKEYSVTPTFNYRQQGNFDQLDLGAYLTLPPLIAGMWYRGLPVKQTEDIANSDAIIFMVGIISKKATFGYSFDYTVSDLGIGTGGAHEISITYAFSLEDPTKPSLRVRKLRCPIPFLF